MTIFAGPDEIVLRGSYLDEPDRLAAIASLEALKLQKLQERHAKNSVKEATINELFFHLSDELREFTLAFASQDTGEMLRELADVSNMVDILYHVILPRHLAGKERT